ncbi:MAG: hypothetical protein J6T62_08880 [Fibrobacter sp.]|nr:hypothetical protein [Fibrobacter sp.]
MSKISFFLLLSSSLAFAIEPSPDLGPIMAEAAVGQGIRMLPLLMLGLVKRRRIIAFAYLVNKIAKPFLVFVSLDLGFFLLML